MVKWWRPVAEIVSLKCKKIPHLLLTKNKTNYLNVKLFQMEILIHSKQHSCIYINLGDINQIFSATVNFFLFVVISLFCSFKNEGNGINFTSDINRTNKNKKASIKTI